MQHYWHVHVSLWKQLYIFKSKFNIMFSHANTKISFIYGYKKIVNVRQDPACKRRLHADSAHCLS